MCSDFITLVGSHAVPPLSFPSGESCCEGVSTWILYGTTGLSQLVVMAGGTRSRLLQLAALAVVISLTTGHYVITTPRKWSQGEKVEICVFSINSADSTNNNNSVAIKLESHNDNTEIIPTRIINIPADRTEQCDTLTLPALGLSKGRLKLTGQIGGHVVNHRRKIQFASRLTKTFVQTDKFLYKPGQEVQFRVLTLSGPFINISTSQYPLVWIETPSGSRIGQWINVDNPSGLIHLKFKLSDEPEKGTYKIHVDSPDGGSAVTQTFKVEDYVLPRFEVTVTPPTLILGDDADFTFNVCAKYTYGQPVKGNVTLEVDNKGWGSSRTVHMVNERISGCKDFLVTAENVAMNGYHYYAHNLEAKATVVEEGTGEVFEDSTSVEIHRTALKFELVGDEKYMKPGLPYTGKVKVQFPDGSAAPGELLEVCASGACKNITTDTTGLLTFVIPQYQDHNINIKSMRFKEPVISEQERPEDGSGGIRFHPWQSWRRIMHPAEFHHRVKRYFSPSNSSLVIHAPTATLPCANGVTSSHALPLLYSAVNQTSASITVQVVSRGKIQYSATEDYSLTTNELPLDGTPLSPIPPPPPHTVRGSVVIPITLPPTVSPTAKVIVWYSRDDGSEIVSDARQLKVETCYINPVSLTWSMARAHPGDQVDINLSSEPSSVCSLGVVDKSVELLSAGTDPLTLSGVLAVVESAMVKDHENSQVDDTEYCRTKLQEGGDVSTPRPPFPPGPIPVPLPGGALPPAGPPAFFPPSNNGRARRSFWGGPRYYSDYVDALKMFDDSGLHIFSDLPVETRPCNQRDDIVYFAAMPIPSPTRRGVVRRPALASPGIHPAPPPSSVMIAHEETLTESDSSSQTRTYFPETWLWQLSIIPESGVMTESVSLPHTITEWVGKAVCVHPSKGLGVSLSAPITTFTPFFIDLTLPPSIKRGETLNVKISVFNYLEADLPVKLVLEPSPDYEIIGDPSLVITTPVEEGAVVEGNADGASPDVVPALRPGQRRSCVPSQDKTVHTVKVRPTALGEVNITVWAEVDPLYPAVCGPEYVLSKRDHLVKPIKVDIEGFPKEKTWTKYICTKDIEENADSLENWNIVAPSDIVPDSARGWITAVGDLLGPTLENLGSLIKMPYGCGEQNMLNFAPNIFILQYLEASQQTTPEIAHKSIEYMEQGYQRELQYRHSVGSYSAFGSSDASGSTWLTAFVLKSFAQARQFIQIDAEDINMSRDWLRLRQMENGCFESVGKVFHKGMKGGIDSEGSPVPLSAYVLISLMESGEPGTSRTVSEAAFCLVADKTQDPYTLALKSYALALSDAPEAQTILNQLIAIATQTPSSMFWELPEGSGKSEAVAVEAAGYAVLAMTTLDSDYYKVPARKVVKWISSQRNGQGGFISTQDTVVALQALASFESHQQKGNATDLMVVVDAGGTLNHNFHIDDNNKLLLQSTPLPSPPTSVFLDMVGEGCALIQAVLRYNIPADPPSEAFTLNVETSTKHDSLCVTKGIKACASYQLPDLKSNMAVIEVNLVSGYIPKKTDLQRIVGYGSGLIKRYEVDGSQVIFYVDEFSARETCVNFDITREVEVDDVKPGTVRVYDYYQPELFTTQSYTLPPNDDCLTGPDPEIIIDGIIVEPIVIDYEEEEGIDPSAIDDLIEALDEMP